MDGDLVDTNFFPQQGNDVRLDADRQRLNYNNFVEDEEVTLIHHRRDMDAPDNPGSDVLDGPDTSDTQREDWLLQMEPLNGLVRCGRQGSDLR